MNVKSKGTFLLICKTEFFNLSFFRRLRCLRPDLEMHFDFLDVQMNI